MTRGTRCPSRQFPDLSGAQRYQEQKNRDAGSKGDQAAPVVISHLRLPLARNPGILALVEVPHGEQRLDRRRVRPAFHVNDKNKAPPPGEAGRRLESGSRNRIQTYPRCGRRAYLASGKSNKPPFIYRAMRAASSDYPRALFAPPECAFNRAKTP